VPDQNKHSEPSQPLDQNVVATASWRGTEVECWRRAIRRRQLPSVILAYVLMLCVLGGLVIFARYLSALPASRIDSRGGLAIVVGVYGLIGLLTVAATTSERERRRFQNLDAWGRRAFENAEARRWLRDLKSQGTEAVTRAFAAVEDGEWSLPEERRALAAAEVIAASAGSVAPGLPLRVRAWLAGRQQETTANLAKRVERARGTVEVVAHGSVQRAADPAYDNYFVALESRLRAAASRPESVGPPRHPLDTASQIWAIFAVMAVCVTVLLAVVQPNLGSWTSYAPGYAVLSVFLGWLPGSLMLLVAWQIWVAHWAAGRNVQRSQVPGTRLSFTRRSLPIVLATLGIFWLIQFLAAPLTFGDSPIFSALPDETNRILLVGSLALLAAGIVAGVLIEMIHRPVWVLPADLRADPDRSIAILDAETVDALLL